MALEARGQPVLMQVASASARAPPSAGFFLDEVTGSSTPDSISTAVREGQRRTSIAEIEAVHQSAAPARGATPKSPERISEDEFRLLKFDTLKLDKLKDVSSKVMSLVAQGARAAAQSVAPSAVQKEALSKTLTPAAPPKTPRRSPSALGVLGQMRQAPISALQRTDNTHAEAGSTRSSDAMARAASSQRQPQRLASKAVAYDEASAEKELQRQREEEEREAHANMEDLMDEVRNRRSW